MMSAITKNVTAPQSATSAKKILSTSGARFDADSGNRDDIKPCIVSFWAAMDCTAIRGRIGRIRRVERERTAAFTAQMDDDECSKRKDGRETSDAEYAHNGDAVSSREWIVVE